MEKRKDFFSARVKNGYYGIKGKVDYVCKLCSLSYDETVAPYKTFLELKNLRDLLVHGKVEKFNFKTTHPAFELPPMYPLILEQTRIEFAEKALEDLLLFAEKIHLIAKSRLKDKTSFRSIWFGNYPFHNAHQYASRTSI